MIGLLMLKHMFDLSDEAVVAQWEENIYYQAFTGEKSFNNTRPCHPSQLTLFRKRIKTEGFELIFAESVRVFGNKVLEKNCIIDTTVQEKNITFPTDSKLIFKAIALILKIASFLKISFRSKFVKELKTIKSKINFGNSQLSSEDRTMCIARIKEIANSLLCTFKMKLPDKAAKQYLVKKLLLVLNKVINQSKNDKNKIYSIHEPQVKCIAKGKAHKKYEFGSKVSLVVSKSSKVILGIRNFLYNPYDGDTLDSAIKQISQLHNGYKPDKICSDRGYRGHDKVRGVEIITPYSLTKGLMKSAFNIVKKLLRSRTAIEPIIGHLKEDHRLSRNRLKGVLGDTINPLLAATAFNLLKYARVQYNSLHKPPRSINLQLRARQNDKYYGLPLYREKNPIF
jgi:IS5 family transposase